MLCVAVEEVAKACASSALILAVQDLASLPIRLAGTDELKERVLPRMASGEWLGAFALSEPEAGSDPGAIRTRAEPGRGGWVLNGAKNWISNASVADIYVVFAVTDPEERTSEAISAFVVPADSDGLELAGLEHKMGMRSPTGQPVFEDCFVDEENMIGERGEGFKIAMRTLDRSRVGVAAQALGLAQGATDYAVSYARERATFGKPINQHQGIQFKLGDMETKTAAARVLLYRRPPRRSALSPTRQVLRDGEAVLLGHGDGGHDRGVQVLGGYGYVTEYPVERMMRDAKLTQIYEGTNEIQRIVVARALAGRRSGVQSIPASSAEHSETLGDVMEGPLPFDPIAEARRQWTAHWGAAATPAMSAVTSIMRAEQILIARLNELLQPFELTFPRYEALMLLYYSRRGALPLGKIGTRLQVHRTSVTNIIDGLEYAGYVSREPHRHDRRTVLASITANGRKTARRATGVLNEARFGTTPLRKSDLEAITKTLEDLRADADGIAPGTPQG